MSTQQTENSPNALMPLGFSSQFLEAVSQREYADVGFVIPADVEVTEDDMLMAGQEIQAARVRGEKLSPFYIGDYLNQLNERHPQAYKKGEEIFGLDKQQKRNYKYACSAVPPERRSKSLKVTFGHHRIVAPLTPEKQIEMLAWVEAGVVDEKTGLRRTPTERELAAHIKQDVATAKGETEEGADTGTQTQETQAPYTTATFTIPAMKTEGETLAGYKKRVETLFAEAFKRHYNPDYGVKAKQKERADAYKGIIESVPKPDRPQFDEMFANGVELSGIRERVKEYHAAVKETADLENILAGFNAEDRAQFETMRAEGKTVKEIREAANSFKSARDLQAQLETAFTEIEKDTTAALTEEEKQGYRDRLAGGEKVKELKSAIKTVLTNRAKDAKRVADNDEIIKEAPEAVRETLAKLSHEGKKPKDLRDEVAAYNKKQSETKKALTKEVRGQLDGLRKQVSDYRKSENVLRETAANNNDKEAAAQADLLAKKATAIEDEITRLEVQHGLTKDTPPANDLSKAAQVARSRGNKGGSKRGNKKR